MARAEMVPGGGFGIDTSDFRAVAKALRAAAPQTAKALRKNLRTAGLGVAAEARKKAGEHSKSIPPTVKVRVASTTVSIVAGGQNAPLAALYEIGNKGRNPGDFRHPVFGNRNVWVTQKGYPFLRPAALAARAELEVAVVAALDEAVRIIQFDR
jgi:hypothetical protein